VINIAIEGMMLTGAFFASVMGSLAANVWHWPAWASLPFGALGALAAGALLGLLLAVLAVRFKVNQIVAGTAINILAVGLTGYVSLGSVLGSIAFPVILALTDGPWRVVAASAAIAVLIVLRHSGNIVRLLQGRERKLGEKAS
jgi:glycerol-3-phosphate acyltransferase PlsY